MDVKRRPCEAGFVLPLAAKGGAISRVQVAGWEFIRRLSLAKQNERPANEFSQFSGYQ
jgi:hypothetical protein